LKKEILAVEAVAPATSANLGAGFDVFGVALTSPRDRVYVEKMDSERIEISVEGEGSDLIPTKPDLNTAGIVARELLATTGRNVGLHIDIRKGVGPGSGLGSSAASSSACALALNVLLQARLSTKELIEYAALGEMASAGTPHADNVAAAILGGFTVVVSRRPLDVVSLRMPPHVGFAIVLPDITYTTKEARTVIPRRVCLSKFVQNLGRAAAFVAGIASEDISLMGRGMMDVVVEPERERLIPGLNDVRKAGLRAGAAGVAISGSGPSVIALVDKSKVDGMQVAKAMRDAFETAGVRARYMCSEPGPGGRVTKCITG
jgi:homoserine kinase